MDILFAFTAGIVLGVLFIWLAYLRKRSQQDAYNERRAEDSFEMWSQLYDKESKK